jgi:hypothetical protein
MEFNREAARGLIVQFHDRMGFAPVGNVLHPMMALATETPDHWVARLVYIDARANAPSTWTWDHRDQVVDDLQVEAWARPLSDIKVIEIRDTRSDYLETAHFAWAVIFDDAEVSLEPVSNNNKHMNDLMQAVVQGCTGAR